MTGSTPKSPDWHKSWHTDWKANRGLPVVYASDAELARGRAELRQSFVLGSGDDVEVVYRLVPGDPVLEIEVVITKAPLSEPHGLYLPLPVALKPSWQCRLRNRRRHRPPR